MKLPDDFRDVLLALDDAKADFIVVGGYAVALHGHMRATKDIDVLVRPDVVNAERVMRALVAFGAPVRALGVSATDFSSPGKVVQLGVPPLRIDILTSVSGVDFEAAVRDPATLDVDGRKIRVIGRQSGSLMIRSTRRVPGERTSQTQSGASSKEGTFGRYARQGVRHAWLVDPIDRSIEVFRLGEAGWIFVQGAGG